jgi:hypothetical protein
MWGAPDSNPGAKTGYPEVFLGIPQECLGKCRNIVLNQAANVSFRKISNSLFSHYLTI